MKRVILWTLLLSMLLSLVACGFGSVINVGIVELKYYDNEGEEGFNTELYYRNDLKQAGCDPGAIYVTEGEYAGYYFVYGTSNDLSGRGYHCHKSKDLSNWEFVSNCFVPEIESWGRTQLWAPEVIYDEELGKYLLFYSAHNSNQKDGYVATKYLGLAMSDSPAGPFVQYTGTNANGTEIGIGDPIFDIELMDHNNPHYKEGTSFIDAHPFVDPVTGDKYLYMARTRNVHETNSCAVVKMIDWFTPDYETYTVLVTPNQTEYDGGEVTEFDEDVINEAPQVLYHDGTYYLTYSCNMAPDKDYCVLQAVSDSPMGPFTKIQMSDGGMVTQVEWVWDHLSTAGSHSFVNNGEEIWIIYHQNFDREAAGTMDRAYAADRIVFVENDKGQTVIRTNGPTYSIQPQPVTTTGYKNLAPLAKVTAKNAIDDSMIKYLNDGAFRTNEIDVIKEFEGTSIIEITLSFDEYITARSLLIYNSYFYDYAFYNVARVDFSFRDVVDGKNVVGTARVENLYYDFEKYSNMDYCIMRPGAPLIIEFAEMEINKITITIACPTGQEKIAISEIMLLGKEIK